MSGIARGGNRAARWRLAAACAAGFALLLAGGADASFTTGSTISTGPAPWRIALADLNGDHVLDFVSANSATVTLTAQLGTGDGQFAVAAPSSPLHPGGGFPNDVKVADMNGDGKADIVDLNYLNY